MISVRVSTYELLLGVKKKEARGRLVIRASGGTLGRIILRVEHLHGEPIVEAELEPGDLRRALAPFYPDQEGR